MSNVINRRRLVQSMGVLSASVAASACSKSALVPSSPRIINVALMGLGYYSRDLLAPALQLTQHCRLAGIVTGSSEKAALWKEKYNLDDQNIYNYDNFDEIANNPNIDVVYIVLPNSMHREFVLRTAKAGKHVWCEKPMAMNVQECQDMIAACDKHKVQLTIGYRLQHEPNTRDVIEMVSNKTFGKTLTVSAQAGFKDGREEYHWRLDPKMGGGAMYDMGVYPLNAARYATGEEPIAVTAKANSIRKALYKDVDEEMTFTLEFPSGAKAECATSFGTNLQALLDVRCENGWFKLDPFQYYSGVKGEASDGRQLNKTVVNQQAKQMDDDALAIIDGTPPLVPGEEGMKDIRVVEAIYKAAKTGKRVVI